MGFRFSGRKPWEWIGTEPEQVRGFIQHQNFIRFNWHQKFLLLVVAIIDGFIILWTWIVKGDHIEYINLIVFLTWVLAILVTVGFHYQ